MDSGGWRLGAKVLYGGKGGIRSRTYYIIDVKPEMKVVSGSVAPVISIIPFDSIEEAFIRPRYEVRLTSYFITSDIILVCGQHRTPFYGKSSMMPHTVLPTCRMAVKDSGIGKEGPHYAKQEMTDEKLVVINHRL
jgi:acyl-CoA reductase-like NAD-dependent aldehyde dehydrogenase